MALTETTLAAECAADAKTIVLTSATGVVVGTRFRIDDENMAATKGYTSGVTVPVRRGLGGGIPTLHPITAAVEHALASDEGWGGIEGQTDVQYPYAPPHRQKSYSASGAIELPNPGSNGFAVLNAVSTTILAMTVALPTKAMDGCRLLIASRNGTGAHTITVAGRLNGAGSGNYTVFTFPANPVMIELIALDSFWYTPSAPAWTGTVTLLTGGIA